MHALAEQRALLLITARDITDAQAAKRTTVSELTLSGIVKHLTRGEQVWTRIMVKGDGELPEGMLDLEQYRMAEGETLAELLEQYRSPPLTAPTSPWLPCRTDWSVPLPKTPWSPPETVHWSARRILLHLIRETAQHAGHAESSGKHSTGRAPPLNGDRPRPGIFEGSQHDRRLAEETETLPTTAPPECPTARASPSEFISIVNPALVGMFDAGQQPVSRHQV